METNFKDPKTGKEYYINNYSMSLNSSGEKVYKDKYRKELVSEDGTPLIPIEREIDYPLGTKVAVYGDTNKRIENREKWLRARAKKHANSLDSKLEKQDRTKQEMTSYLNKQ